MIAALRSLLHERDLDAGVERRGRDDIQELASLTLYEQLQITGFRPARHFRARRLISL